MLPSLCRAMAVNEPVSRFVGRSQAAGRDSLSVSLPPAGTIVAWIVARLCVSGRYRAGFSPVPLAGCCRVPGGVAGSAVAGGSRQWQTPAR